MRTCAVAMIVGILAPRSFSSCTMTIWSFLRSSGARHVQGALSARHLTAASACSRDSGGVDSFQPSDLAVVWKASTTISRWYCDPAPATRRTPSARAKATGNARQIAMTQAAVSLTNRMYSPVLFEDSNLRSVDRHGVCLILALA